MKKILKTILISALAVILGMSVIACSGANGKTTDAPGLYVKKIDGVYTVYKYVKEDGVKELDLAKELAELEITDTNIRIQAEAFNGNDTIEKLIVPASVETIDKGAFAGMRKIKELVVPFVGMTKISDTFVGEYADVESEIAKSVDSERTIAHFFGETAFDEGVSMTINFGTGSSQSSACYIPLTLEKITIKADGEYQIPMCAFNGLTMPMEIALEGNITEIGQYAFANSSQTKITLPISVEKIHDGAFSNATKLEEINLSDLSKLEVIGEKAFLNTEITRLILSASVKKLGDSAFSGCLKLKTVFTNSNLEIGNFAFYDCESLVYFGASSNMTAGIEPTIYKTGHIVGNLAFDTGVEYIVK